MKPIACNYYVTARCNDQCEFCMHWSQGNQADDAPLEQVKKNLSGLRQLGVNYLDVTGGEPLLREDLPEILAYAKKLKFFTVLTTNGLLFPEKGSSLVKYCDRLLFSLDFPDPAQHDISRDENLFSSVIESIRIAKKLGKNPMIIFTLTRASVCFLPEMRELAEKHNVLVWLNPAYASPAHDRLSAESIDYVKYFLRQPHFAGNYAALKLLAKWGNNVSWPICKAARSVITITADSYVVAPCFYNPQIKIKIKDNLKEIFNSAEYRRALGLQGRDPACSGCLVWGYMLPSLWFRLDRYFFLNLFSGVQLLLKEYLIKGGSHD